MNAQITDNLKFMGRLSMYKLYGGGDVPVFNGQPNTVYTDSTRAKSPSNDVLHVERALLRYDFPNAPFTIAFGRMNSSDGPPLEIKEETRTPGHADGPHGERRGGRRPRRLAHGPHRPARRAPTLGICGGHRLRVRLRRRRPGERRTTP